MISTRTRLVTHPARADDVSGYRPHPERPPDCAHPHRSRSSSFPATSSVTRTISVQSARWFTHGGWFSSCVQQCPVELAVARPCRSAALAATRGTRHSPVSDGRRPHPTGMSRNPHAAHPGSGPREARVWRQDRRHPDSRYLSDRHPARAMPPRSEGDIVISRALPAVLDLAGGDALTGRAARVLGGERTWRVCATSSG